MHNITCTFSSLLESVVEDDDISLYSTQVHVDLEENSTTPSKTSEKLKKQKLKLHHLHSDTVSHSKKTSPENKDDNISKDKNQMGRDNKEIDENEDEDDHKRKKISKF